MQITIGIYYILHVTLLLSLYYRVIPHSMWLTNEQHDDHKISLPELTPCHGIEEMISLHQFFYLA